MFIEIDVDIAIFCTAKYNNLYISACVHRLVVDSSAPKQVLVITDSKGRVSLFISRAPTAGQGIQCVHIGERTLPQTSPVMEKSTKRECRRGIVEIQSLYKNSDGGHKRKPRYELLARYSPTSYLGTGKKNQETKQRPPCPARHPPSNVLTVS